jgi:hypothetical protein
MSEAEWSQHKKLIDFASRPGGFRRMMVPNLPYFMVQFDYKGEKGYGHVIEGSGDTIGDDEGLDEGEKGGGDFPKWVILFRPQRCPPCSCRADTLLGKSLGTYWSWNRDNGDDLDAWILARTKRGWQSSRKTTTGLTGLG